MREVKCPFCKKINIAKNKATKKSCEICLFWGNRIKNKKNVSRDIKIKIVNKLTSLKQECISCKSKNNLTVDRIIPNNRGGKYDVDNVQILCYKCNCFIKIDNLNTDTSKQNISSIKCLHCKLVKPLSDYHKKGYKSKYRENIRSMYNTRCKKCRNFLNKRFELECKFCAKEFLGSKKTTQFCSVSCSKRFRDNMI